MSDQNVSPEKHRRPKLFYGYILVSSAVIIQIAAWGTYNAYGVFFNPLLAEFGWHRATISGALSLAQLVIGIGAIFLGNLNDRFGPRLLMMSCGIVAGVGYFLMSQVNSIWQLYLFHGLIVGIGLSGTDVILLSTTARWFIRRRGMMSGIVKMGTGTGIMILPLVYAWLISGHGWRTSYAIIGVALIIIVAAGSQLLRRDPAQMHLLPDGVATGQSADVPLIEAGLSFNQAYRTRQFWTLCLAYMAIIFCGNTIIVHIAPYAVDLGLAESFGATILSVIGGVSVISRLIMGITGDKIGGKRALLICFVILGVAFSWLLLVRGSWALVLFAVVYGFCHGGFYALLSPTVAEFFGTRYHGLIFGIVIFFGSVGGCIGPIVSGYIFDTTGSYQAAFLLMLSLSVIGFLLILSSGSGGRRGVTSI